MEDNFQKLYTISDAFTEKFPDNDPFRLMTILAEECGEVAKQINHFENMGTKKKKHGEPNKEKLAGELRDVLHISLQIARYYRIEKQLHEAINNYYQKFVEEG